MSFEQYNDSYTVSELRKIAIENGVKPKSMRKKELIQAIIRKLKSKNRKWRFAAVVGGLAATVGTAAYTKKRLEIVDLEKKVDNLKYEFDSVNIGKKKFKERIGLMKQENATLLKKARELRELHKVLQRENELLKQRLFDMGRIDKKVQKNESTLKKISKKLTKLIEQGKDKITHDKGHGYRREGETGLETSFNYHRRGPETSFNYYPREGERSPPTVPRRSA